MSMESSLSSLLQVDGFADLALSRRWILVAGTGLEFGTPEEDILAAKAVGEELARHRYGLITGVWHGVDYIVTQSFLDQLRRLSLDPKDYLIQVVPEDRPLYHNEGHIVRTPYGGREWLEPQKYADAVVLIGGRGGTYRTWLGALHDGIPRFPLGGTREDAEKAFRETLDLWELIPVPGITRAEFERLGRKIQSEPDAELVAQYLVGELLWRSLDAVDAFSRGNVDGAASMFISYSRKDSSWVTRFRTLLRPAERRGVISTWADADIAPGKPWEPQILARLEQSQAALLLVTGNLLESRYVRDIEIPAFMERIKTMGTSFHLFWVLLEPCNWQSIPALTTIQAIGGVATAVNQSPTRADEQCRLVEVVKTIEHAISARRASESRHVRHNSQQDHL
jgi:TIR domain